VRAAVPAPSDEVTTMPAMVHALLTCSEDECTDVYEVYGPLEEIEALACDCGCGLAIVGWPDTTDGLPTSSGVELLPLAA